MNTKKENALKQLDIELGGWGRFQKWIFFLSCIVAAMCGMSVVNTVFTIFSVPYRCLIPSCEDPSNSTFVGNFLNFTTPFDQSKGSWSSCQTYRQTNETFPAGTCEPRGFDSERTQQCSKWVYDTSIFTSTLVTEFDLTCDRAWLQSLGSSAYMIGMPFGALLLGDIADRLGRRKGMVLSICVMLFGELLAAFSVNFYMYFFMRIFSGAGSIAAFQVAIIQALENVGCDKRTLCGMMIKIPFAIGETCLAAFAYFIRDWRRFQFSVSVPILSLLSYWWIMPESIRWLLANGKYDEARRTIEKASAFNKIHISENVYNTLCTNEGEKEEEEKVKRSWSDLFKMSRMRNRTLILIISWIIITLNFFGLSTNSSNFGGNLFLNFVAVMAIEIPSYIFAYFILHKLGRKGTLVFLMLFGGLTCFASCLVHKDANVTLLVMNLVGKFCVSASFTVIYIYTIELFPTQYRSLGLGMCSMTARLGGVISPFVSGMGKVHRQLPLIIFGATSIICAFVLCLLPETHGAELAQTLEESDRFGKDQSFLHFVCFERKRRNVQEKSEEPETTEF